MKWVKLPIPIPGFTEIQWLKKIINKTEMSKPYHYLEEALHQAILNKESESAHAQISLILKSRDASLSTPDEQGRSFLLLALDVGMQEIATELLTLQRMESNLVFGKANNNRMPIHEAAKHGFIEILKIIFEAAGKTNHFTLFDHDDCGLTALHEASLSGGEEVVLFLLDNLKNVDYINQVDKSGETALHKAFKSFRYNSYEDLSIRNRIIGHLINSAASLIIANNAQVTPFTLLSNLAADKQSEIFNTLNQDRKEEFLSHYRKLLSRESDTDKKEHLKAIYFKFAGLQSLQSLLIAHHEFNNSIPIRNYYVDVLRRSEKADTLGNFPIKIEEKIINQEILQRMPLYLEKLKYTAEQMRIKLDIDSKNPSKKTKESDNQKAYTLLNQDRKILSLLIHDLMAYEQSLRAMPTLSRKNKVLSRLIPSILLLTYVGIESWFIHQAMVADYDERKNIHSQTNFEAITFGVGGSLIVTGFGGVGYSFFSRRKTYISAQEWMPLLKRLQKDLLWKLQHFKAIQTNSTQVLLPTDLADILDLETEIDALQYKKYPLLGKVSIHSLPLEEVIAIFSRIKNLVTIIRDNLNLRQKPISLFLLEEEETAIPMPIRMEEKADEEEEEAATDDEQLPLLRYN